jgi:hypothetical protein
MPLEKAKDVPWTASELFVYPNPFATIKLSKKEGTLEANGRYGGL